jgi:glycerol kinase
VTGERKIVLGVDQGTTNTKVVALDQRGTVVGTAMRRIASSAPQPGWIEQDPQAMFRNVVECIRDVLTRSGCSATDVVGLGVSNQTETLVIWDRGTGTPVMPAILWQCRRGTEQAARLRSVGAGKGVNARTGLDLDPTFTALKLMWVVENAPEIGKKLRTGMLAFGTVDTWLMWCMSGGSVYATEPGNASRTMLFDIHDLAWSDDLLGLFGLSFAALPECHRSAHRFGATDPALFGSAIPITAALGDQQASLFGHGCFSKGQSKVSYGTGAFVWANAGTVVPNARIEGLIRTVAWQIEQPFYAFEGFVMQAGSALEWVAQILGCEDGSIGTIHEAESAQESAGVILVPAFQGLAAPWWEPKARAAFLGLSAAATSPHLAHSALEAVCYQVRTVIDSVAKAVDSPLRSIKVDGGLSRSRYLMQLQADILGAPLLLAQSDLITPVGAAMMAGLGSGFWDDLSDLQDLVQEGALVDPDLTTKTRWDKDYEEWRRAVDAVVAFHHRGASSLGSRVPDKAT